MLKRAAIIFALVSSCATTVAAADNARTLQIIVSKDSQSLAVYDGGTVIATSKVSTGKEGHDTPTGIFSVLEKRKYHESNLYSNAPMPWMQRLTWSGIALHESNSVPNYPASHGCVRLPAAFAKSLYQMTTRGVHVIISDAAVSPQPITHAALFAPPAERPAGNVLSDASLRPSSADQAVRQVEVAMNMPASPVSLPLPKEAASAADEPAPLRILITRRSERETIADVQAMLTELGFDAGTVDGILGSATRSAIDAYKRWKGFATKGPVLTAEVLSALYASSGRAEPPTGQLLVRQGFQEVLSEPIVLADPNVALGTHFLSVTAINRDKGTAEWQGLSLANHLPEATRKRLGITSDAVEGPDALKAVLDRIHVPEDLRQRIGAMISTGTSLTISDTGVGPETTKGTDFITVTHRPPRG
ncbi:L,D-transpeptidase family protein [Rhizobium sp. SL86]|uniref:L,D-transpeptidase family protein n=1 Tax=Rhizobium sp. SL86 TaxID=2995148 RepID=UPI00227280DF|nr:L,D-transpeptidase family protein [Rhizobium sp. SL86]MCY1668340.1 L,D-transpeptidase family protein [Rhizobium sp. SL86]